MRQILVVDDSRVIRRIAKSTLQALGFVTREAENGFEALRCCQAVMPDAILLDWHMPVMDGLSFLQRLRQLPEGQRPKVVFCTTEKELPQITAALEAGADEYIMTPFDQNIIASKLEEVGLLSPVLVR